MRKALVTGANGLLGRTLCNKLSQECDLYAIVRSKPKDPVDSINYISLDLSREFSFDELPSEIDCVLHLAQSNKYKDFPEGASDVFSINVKSTHNLLEYSRISKVKQFIYASSGGVYAESKNPLSECSPIQEHENLGCYLGSKICGEILVQNYSAFFTTSIIRPFFMYGIGQKRNMLLPRLFDNVSNGNSIDLSGDEGLKINPIHVEDAVRAIESLIGMNHSSIYNLAGPDVLSLREICETIGEYLDEKPVFNHADGSSVNIVADISLMKSELHRPIISLHERIDDLR
mgnify:CR=1 FL=1